MFPQHQLGGLLNTDSFLLSIVILLCMMLTIVIGMLVWFQDKEYKFSVTYLIVILLVYQGSSLLAFYSPPEYFETLILVKMVFAFLLKSAVLVWLADYLKNPILLNLFLALHLLAMILIWPLFFYTPMRDAIVTINSASNTAVYEQGAKVYTVLSSIIYIIAGILFYLTNRRFRQSRRYFVFLLVYIFLNTGLLFFGTFLSSDVLYEKMHLFVLLMLLAVFFRLTPFIEHGDWIMSPANFLQGMVEAVVILDRQGNVVYSHNGIKDINIKSQIPEIKKKIEVQQVSPLLGGVEKLEMNAPHVEGIVKMDTDKPINLQYKFAPLYVGKILIGKIIVLRDLTPYTDALQSLNEKNHLIKEALEKQNNYIRVMQRITGEKEREKVLQRVNKSMRGYLEHLKKQVKQFGGPEALLETGYKDRVKKRNDEMLALTRQLIDETRQAVKNLNSIGVEKEGGQ